MDSAVREEGVFRKMGMSVRDSVKAIGLVGVVAMILPMGIQAAPVFDNWSADTGTITPDTGAGSYCGSTGVSCTPLVSGDGFLQQQVVDSGVTYIQTIITDSGAGAVGGTAAPGLPYSDESFIRQGATNGIMSQQRSVESTTGTNTQFDFSNTVSLYTGWAAGFIPGGEANVNINQSFTDAGKTTVTGDGLFNSFIMNINLDAAGTVTGKKTSLRQDLGMGDGTATNTTDSQSFVLEQRSGDLNGAAGSLALGTSSSGTGGGTVNWVAGDDVLVAWLGQQVNTAATGDPVSLSKFGFESVANNTGTPVSATTFSTDQVNVDNGAGGIAAPYAWDAAFGTAPTLKLPPQP